MRYSSPRFTIITSVPLGRFIVFQGVCLLQHFLCNGHVVQVGVNLFGQFNSEIISGLFQRGGEAKQPGYPGDCGTLDDQ